MARAAWHKGEAGFSLIELLVAVAILALAAVTLLESQTQAIGMTSAVERRTLAATVAENRLAEALGHSVPPLPGTTTGDEAQMGETFTWHQRARPAPGGDLTIIEVSVSGADGLELASLTGFRKVEKK